MTRHEKKPVYTFLGTILSIILLAGCVVHVGADESERTNSSWSDGQSYSEINKSIRISDGENVGNVSSVNGSLTMGDKVSAEKVTSVNGRLQVGTGASVNELSTVNGSLSAEAGLRARGNVSTVNGSINLHDDSEVGGSVSTVNGSIKLKGVSIDENIETVNGSIHLEDNTVVRGDITFHWNKNNTYKGNNPTLTIDSSSTVEGNIYLERPVDLDFADESLKNRVVKNF